MNNKKISEISEKEWNKIKHLYSPDNKFNFKKRTKNLLEVKSIFDSMNIKFFLVHGALLGAYRDNDFIKYDEDIELDIFDETFKRHYKKLYKKFIKAGFIVRSTKISSKKKGGKFNLYKSKEKITIRSLYIDENYKKGKYRLTNNFKYLKKFFEKPSKIKFKNKVFTTPGPIEEYLIYVYGDKWRTPIRSKNKLIKEWRGMEVRRKYDK